jgi:hypothetical protein
VRRYGAFECDGSPDIEFDVQWADDMLVEPVPPTVTPTDNGAKFFRHEYDVTMTWDNGFRGGGVVQYAATSMDTMMRVVLTHFLDVQNLGFLVHSCGLALSDRGYLFPGPSEMGKSTLAMKVGRPATLSDELNCITRREDGWWIHATPFWGSFEYGERNRSLPLERITFLNRHSPRGFRPISTADAVTRLMTLILCFDYSREASQRHLERFTDLVTSVPVYELSYDKEQTLAAVMEMMSL